MWSRLGHFVPSRQTGGGGEQKPSFWLKNAKRLLLCTPSSALGPLRAHAGEIGRALGQWGTGRKALGSGWPLPLGWHLSPPLRSPPRTCPRLHISAALFLGCCAHHREACVNGNIPEEEKLLKRGGHVVRYLSARVVCE